MANRLSPAWQFQLDDYPTALCVSRDGAVVAAGTAAGSITLFDASSGDLLHSLSSHSNGVLSASFGRKLLASGGQDGCVKLWDARSGSLLSRRDAEGAWVEQLCWTPDGKRLAAAAGRTVLFLDEADALLGRFKLKAGVNGLGFNPVGGLLAVAAGAEMSLLRAADGGVDRSFKWASTLLNLHFSPDGKIIACGSIDKTVHFWRSGVWTDSQMAGYLTKPLSLAWSADSKQLATTGDECIIVWNFAGKGPEGVTPMQLYGHVTPPSLVAMHPKKPLLLSGAKDHRVLLWQPKLGPEPIGLVKMAGAITGLAFNPSASLAYSTDESGLLQAWWIEPANQAAGLRAVV